MQINEKALKFANKTTGWVEAICREIVTAYLSALPQCAVDEREAFSAWAKSAGIEAHHADIAAAEMAWNARAKTCPAPATESYNSAMVAKLLKARNAIPAATFSNSDDFFAWLDTKQCPVPATESVNESFVTVTLPTVMEPGKEMAFLAKGQACRIVAPFVKPESVNAELLAGLKANDILIREIRHRDARWHDDELARRVLDQNAKTIAAAEQKGESHG